MLNVVLLNHKTFTDTSDTRGENIFEQVFDGPKEEDEERKEKKKEKTKR